MRAEGARRVAASPLHLPSALGRLSLRSRLLAGLVVVSALGLGIASAVIYRQIRSYLVNQVVVQAGQAASDVHGASFCGGGRGLAAPVGTDVVVYQLTVSASAATLQQACAVPADPQAAALTPASTPIVPVWLLRDAAGPQLSAATSTTSSDGAGFELYATQSGGFGGLSGVVVAAVPLAPVEADLHELVLIDVAVSLAVLAMIAVLGYAVVRVGLRPLEEIEETAGKIAAGDLSRRVEREEPGTEVGRLGGSLNAMLGQIERAFGEQQASEHRLRQFIADASHELRTPLTSIRGYAELFRRGAASRPEDLERSMRRIEDEAARMGVLVDDLLLLARLDQGRPVDHEPVDLAQIAADATADAQAVDPDRPLSFLASGPAVVLGDEARLRQVVANLVQNALVHTPPGTPVHVSVAVRGSHAVIEVADEGPGIAPEHAARIFERFYRADSSRARQSGGTGLGLAIVASLAAAHGGRARVETAPGAGTRFVVELPAAPDAGDASSPPAEMPASVPRPRRPELASQAEARLEAAPPGVAEDWHALPADPAVRAGAAPAPGLAGSERVSQPLE